MLREAGVDPVRVVPAELSSDMNTLWGVLRQGLGAVSRPLEGAKALSAARRDAEARQQQQQADQEVERRRKPVIELAPGIGMAFVLVPAGPFSMGSDKNSNERPVHEVSLDAYYIGKYPVTKAQFAAFVAATKYDCNGNAIADLKAKANHPVTHVSWNDAVAFCTWAAKSTGYAIRLPTEAEWEKAARGTDRREYPWGNDSPDDSRCRFSKMFGGTTPVGQFSPRGDSPYGAADMAGNVFEWCADWLDSNYYRTSPSTNPTGPNSGRNRVVRGGSWYLYTYVVRAAYRYNYSPGPGHVGFRVARSL